MEREALRSETQAGPPRGEGRPGLKRTKVGVGVSPGFRRREHDAERFGDRG